MEQTAKQRAAALGKIVKELRNEQGLTLEEMTKRTGLGKSYLSYIESGRFAEIGIDKFSRIVQALGAPADWMLAKAGYLPEASLPPAKLRTAIKEQMGLSPAQIDHVLSYLEFLAKKNSPKPRRTK